MGWDVTYHPFKPEEVAEVYFAGVSDPERVAGFIAAYGMPEFHIDNLKGAFKHAQRFTDEPFNPNHGYMLAIVAGHLRKYWYVRNGSLSFLWDDPAFRPFFGDWKTLVPREYAHLAFENHLTESYCLGVFMDHATLAAFKNALAENEFMRSAMKGIFSHGRFEVFMAAVDYALENGLGLLEAAEVIIPNPLDLNNSECFSNLHNCDPSGAILYHEAACWP